MSSLLTESMAYVKEFDYSENVSKLQTSFVNNFSDMSEFLYKYKIQLMVIQILFFMYSMHRYSNIVKGLREISLEKRVLTDSMINFNAQQDEIKKEHLLYSYKKSYDAKNSLNEEIKVLLRICNKLHFSHKKINEIRNSELHKKFKDIESIMIDGIYNDRDYLIYDDENWTLDKLLEESKDNENSEYSFGRS